MAATRLTDVIIPEVYQTYSTVDDTEKTAFVQSGIAVSNPDLEAKASSGGHTLHLPFWKDLDASAEPNLSSDDPSQLATPQKITAGDQEARMAYLNQWYSAADLAGEMAGSNPMQRIRNRFSVYWQRQFQRRMLAMSSGILADNITSNDGDMVNDISVDDGAQIGAGNLFRRSAFTSAAFTMGDMFESVTAMAVHSVVYNRIIDNDENVEDAKDADGTLYKLYMGRRLIIDDQMPVVPVTTGTGFKYTSVLFGAGAFGYGDGSALVPVETERRGREGNGGGVEYVGERKSWLIHPFGYKVSTAPANVAGYTLAELKGAVTWERVVERKSVPLAFLVTNG